MRIENLDSKYTRAESMSSRVRTKIEDPERAARSLDEEASRARHLSLTPTENALPVPKLSASHRRDLAAKILMRPPSNLSYLCVEHSVVNKYSSGPQSTELERQMYMYMYLYFDLGSKASTHNGRPNELAHFQLLPRRIRVLELVDGRPDASLASASTC